MRVATIDIGTNTVLLLVAERGADGELVAVEERATITRLGQGVDATSALRPEAIARTNECLSEYAAVISAARVDRVAVVGTSAMRDARGGEEVRAHIARALGVEARVISGDEEARLTFTGAVSGLGLGREVSQRRVSVFDIGGGSTEVVRGEIEPSGAAGAIEHARSFDVGSVRWTERHVRHDPPDAGELAAMRDAAREAFAPVPRSAGGEEIIGIAGTMTTLAAVALAMEPYDGARVHGHVLERSELERVVAELAALDVEARRAVRGMEPKRADVIVAGGVIALALLDRLGASRVRISDRGVRWGLAGALTQASSPHLT
jgi:exopolyphosphatase/guanosine-5'-triphosphate,3'-diphosphate pyrophosphatase